MESNVKINLNDVILCYVEGGDEIKAKNFFDLITFVVNLNIKTLYKILIEIKSNAIHYKIDKSEIVDSCKKLPFFGIKGDFMFKEFKTGIFREDHFLDVIKSLNIYWKNNNLNPVKQRIILDIGANIGSHSIVLAKFFPSHSILSFEANSKVFPLLQLNTLEIDNIKSFQLAVFNETGLVLGMEPLVYNDKTTNSGWFSTTDINFLNPCITLKLDDLDLNSVDFIKMDIQGGEIKALEGLSKTIIKCKPIIFIEIEEHHLVKNNSNSRNVLNYFSFLNYDVYRFETSYPTDHVAVPKNSIMDWLKSGYKVTKCPEKTT